MTFQDSEVYMKDTKLFTQKKQKCNKGDKKQYSKNNTTYTVHTHGEYLNTHKLSKNSIKIATERTKLIFQIKRFREICESSKRIEQKQNQVERIQKHSSEINNKSERNSQSSTLNDLIAIVTEMLWEEKRV